MGENIYILIFVFKFCFFNKGKVIGNRYRGLWLDFLLGYKMVFLKFWFIFYFYEGNLWNKLKLLKSIGKVVFDMRSLFNRILIEICKVINFC